MIIVFGFKELKLDKITAFTHNENENSIRLLKSIGFHSMENRKDLDNESNIIFKIESASS